MSSLFNFLASSDNPNSLGYKFRIKRLQEFEKLFFAQFSDFKKIEQMALQQKQAKLMDSFLKELRDAIPVQVTE
jgi:hypothetical protein